MQILIFIRNAWGPTFRVALVSIALVGVLGLTASCSSSLNEHSSCQDFEQADTATQNQVLQDMMAAHGSQGSLDLTRTSVELYCSFHDSSSPIDGIYGSGNVGQPPAQALHRAAPLARSQRLVSSEPVRMW